jgi:hypothetical protein
VVRLKVKHIDSAQKIIRIEQSKRPQAPQCDAGVPRPERWQFPSKKILADLSPPASSTVCSMKRPTLQGSRRA